MNMNSSTNESVPTAFQIITFLKHLKTELEVAAVRNGLSALERLDAEEVFMKDCIMELYKGLVEGCDGDSAVNMNIDEIECTAPIDVPLLETLKAREAYLQFITEEVLRSREQLTFSWKTIIKNLCEMELKLLERDEQKTMCIDEEEKNRLENASGRKLEEVQKDYYEMIELMAKIVNGLQAERDKIREIVQASEDMRTVD